MRQLKITKQVTNRETPSLDKYLQEIGRVSLLTAEQEVEIARKIKKGDELALHRLVKANLRFVVSVSKQYQNQGLSLSDLINEGNLGLLKAAQRFDETKGFKFISYAVWWIRQSILQALSEQARIVRLPLNKIGAVNKVNNATALLEQKFEREPSPTEIARELEIAPGDVKEAIKHNSKHVSMDSPIKDDENSSFYEVMMSEDSPRPDKNLIHESLQVEIERTLSVLSPREADIIRSYYGLSGKITQTLEEIGAEFTLTRERVRQIKEKAIKRLRLSPRNKILRNYLG